MKCTRCHGTGKITEWVATDTLSEYEFPCRKCNGTGEIKVTNEEWFCGLSTEEKAKFLRKIYCDGRDDYVGEWYEQEEEDFLQWLKEKHDDSVQG